MTEGESWKTSGKKHHNEVRRRNGRCKPARTRADRILVLTEAARGNPSGFVASSSTIAPGRARHDAVRGTRGVRGARMARANGAVVSGAHDARNERARHDISAHPANHPPPNAIRPHKFPSTASISTRIDLRVSSLIIHLPGRRRTSNRYFY